ncbi:MAG: bacillithiol biosynthesis cysteine-adding enzyme BshC [Flavobacteriales bacterium]
MSNIKLIESFTPKLPRLVRDYLGGKPEARALVQYSPDLNGLKSVALSRSGKNVNRQVLVDVLIEQAKASNYSSERSLAQIERLRSEDVFTVTTGHQLCIYGGPLFFFYKILSAVKLTEQLSQQGIHSVPIYWMASEDHDFEEINHIWLKGRKIEWRTEAIGAVGELKCSSMLWFKDEVKAELKDDHRYVDVLKDLDLIYSSDKTLAEATRDLVYRVFAETGLVVLDANDHRLKTLFGEFVETEIKEHFSSEALAITNTDLETLGYDRQVTGREINLFWMEENYRSRIVQQSMQLFSTADGLREWTRDELLSQVDSNPQHFSPNVILRPLYQEVILPNIAYIGGPGELSYWLQLKGVFESAKVNMPVVLLRDMFLITDEVAQRKMTQLGLNYADLQRSFDQVLDTLLRSLGTHEAIVESKAKIIEHELDSMMIELEKIYPGLRESADSEKTRILKRLEALRKKVFRADRQGGDVTRDRLEFIFQRTFPNGIPQERISNWMDFFFDFDKLLQILSICDPLENKLRIIQQ